MILFFLFMIRFLIFLLLRLFGCAPFLKLFLASTFFIYYHIGWSAPLLSQTGLGFFYIKKPFLQNLCKRDEGTGHSRHAHVETRAIFFVNYLIISLISLSVAIFVIVSLMYAMRELSSLVSEIILFELPFN